MNIVIQDLVSECIHGDVLKTQLRWERKAYSCKKSLFFMGVDTKHCNGFKERIGKYAMKEINMKFGL